jgi:hypothetical protein
MIQQNTQYSLFSLCFSLLCLSLLLSKSNIRILIERDKIRDATHGMWLYNKIWSSIEHHITINGLCACVEGQRASYGGPFFLDAKTRMDAQAYSPVSHQKGSCPINACNHLNL